jgi:hypothetical protein
MKYIAAQPESKYYEWQIDTMIHSYIKQGVNPNDIIILWGNTGEYNCDSLRKKYPTVNFYRYEWKNEAYPPAIKPYLMSKYFGSCKCTQGEQYYYADADTILTKPLPKFPHDTVFMSDTRSYIGIKYIRSKGEEILDKMCEAAKIDKKMLEERDLEAGGCQFVFSGTDSKFWKDVYVNSNALYRAMREYNQEHQEKYEGTHPIQAWTAEMWATLWQFWKKGYRTEISKELSFAWSTDPLNMLEDKRILHNAGVTNKHKDFFVKSHYVTKAPPSDLNITKTHCSYYYYKQVLEAIC